VLPSLLAIADEVIEYLFLLRCRSLVVADFVAKLVDDFGKP